jgi:hypothetical protein
LEQEVMVQHFPLEFVNMSHNNLGEVWKGTWVNKVVAVKKLPFAPHA